MALVSVIIPYYKKINQISKTLNSVLAQTFQDFEIILIYDDTNINDLVYIKESFSKNSKIKIVQNKKNYGAGMSRNIGIKHSSGNIIAFLDADDIWYSDKLEKQVKFMRENKYNFSFTNYLKKISNKKSIHVQSKKRKISYKDLLQDNEIGLSTVMLNKNIIKNELFPSLKTKEDYVAWLKLSKENYIAYNLNEFLSEWNFSKNSLSSNLLQKVLDGFRVYYIYLDFNFLKSLFYLLRLSINSINRKF